VPGLFQVLKCGATSRAGGGHKQVCLSARWCADPSETHLSTGRGTSRPHYNTSASLRLIWVSSEPLLLRIPAHSSLGMGWRRHRGCVMTERWLGTRHAWSPGCDRSLCSVKLGAPRHDTHGVPAAASARRLLAANHTFFRMRTFTLRRLPPALARAAL
jgi:hypothetical protein